jgi:hypothetical protein
MLHVACCMRACCMLRVVCCTLRVACCMLRVARCTLPAATAHAALGIVALLTAGRASEGSIGRSVGAGLKPSYPSRLGWVTGVKARLPRDESAMPRARLTTDPSRCSHGRMLCRPVPRAARAPPLPSAARAEGAPAFPIIRRSPARAEATAQSAPPSSAFATSAPFRSWCRRIRYSDAASAPVACDACTHTGACSPRGRRKYHICAGTRLATATSALGLGEFGRPQRRHDRRGEWRSAGGRPWRPFPCTGTCAAGRKRKTL